MAATLVNEAFGLLLRMSLSFPGIYSVVLRSLTDSPQGRAADSGSDPDDGMHRSVSCNIPPSLSSSLDGSTSNNPSFRLSRGPRSDQERILQLLGPLHPDRPPHLRPVHELYPPAEEDSSGA